MKTVFALILIFGTQGALGQTNRTCLSNATKVASEKFDEYIASIPNASSPEGLEHVKRSAAAAGNLNSYNANGEYFTYTPYGFSYDVDVTVSIVLNNKCESKKVAVSERILNVSPPADEPDSLLSCVQEVGLQCAAGMIDRCKFPKAETHHCVPDIH